MHILLVRFSSLGDIVLNTSLPHSMKMRWGSDLKITWLTSVEFAPLLDGHHSIDRVLPFNRKEGLKKLYKLVEKLNKDDPVHLMLDLHGTLRSLALRWKFRKIPRLYVDKRSLERWLLTGLKIDLLSRMGHSRRVGSFGELLLERNPRDFNGLFDLNFSVGEHAQSLGSTTEQLSAIGPSFIEDDFDVSIFGESLKRKKYICLCPSASFPEKRWSIERFKELAKMLCSEKSFEDYCIVILAGPADNFCDQFNSLKEEYPERFYNLQGKTNFLETSYLVKHARFCIGNDTGVPHIAESLGTASLFILGPTGEQGGFYPHLLSSRIIFKKLWCRPCTTNGKGSCIRSERFCLTQISSQEVFEKAVDLEEGLLS